MTMHVNLNLSLFGLCFVLQKSFCCTFGATGGGLQTLEVLKKDGKHP